MVKLLKTQEIASTSYLYLRESSAPGKQHGSLSKETF